MAPGVSHAKTVASGVSRHKAVINKAEIQSEIRDQKARLTCNDLNHFFGYQNKTTRSSITCLANQRKRCILKKLTKAFLKLDEANLIYKELASEFNNPDTKRELIDEIDRVFYFQKENLKYLQYYLNNDATENLLSMAEGLMADIYVAALKESNVNAVKVDLAWYMIGTSYQNLSTEELLDLEKRICQRFEKVYTNFGLSVVPVVTGYFGGVSKDLDYAFITQEIVSKCRH